MQLIDEGVLTCEDLLLCLKQYFGNSVYHSDVESSIASVSNHKGNWSIGFVGVPPVKTVMGLLSVLDSEILPQCADHVDKVVFNEGAANELVFDFKQTQDLFGEKDICLVMLGSADWS